VLEVAVRRTDAKNPLLGLGVVVRVAVLVALPSRVLTPIAAAGIGRERSRVAVAGHGEHVVVLRAAVCSRVEGAKGVSPVANPR
jgi:hypothetical protein